MEQSKQQQVAAVATTTCAQVHFVVEAIQVIHSGVYIDQFDLFVCKGYSFDANLVARASKHWVASSTLV